MANTQRYSVGYTNAYGEDVEVSRFTTLAEAINARRGCNKLDPSEDYRVWEYVRGGAHV